MSAADFQIRPLHAIGRAIHDHGQHRKGLHNDAAADAFQNNVARRFLALSSSSDEFLSLPWLRGLLEAFAACQEEFRILLRNNRWCVANPAMERIIGDFYERSVKALDVCNAIMDGIEQIRQWKKLLEIVFDAIGNGNSRRKSSQLGEGQIRRAKKALADLAIGMLEDKGSSSFFHRSRSFGRNQSSKDPRSLRKTLSWSVSRSWSASRQIQAIGCNISPPKGNDDSTTHGLPAAVYTMNCVLFIVMWSLVAAIPCHDRGLQGHLSVPRHFPWAAPVLSIHDRVVELSKKRERKHACGLLEEIHGVDKWAREINRLLEFPVVREKEAEVRVKVEEAHEVFEGLEQLDQQVRRAFHSIVRSRMQGLDCLGGSCDCEHKRHADLLALESLH